MSDQVTLLSYERLRERGVEYSRTHVRRLEKRHEFPQHVQIGPNRIGWIQSEIDQFLAQRVARRDAARTSPATAPRRRRPLP
jgi:prophage regulatory protein